jgi:hypothetical protein
MTGERQDMSVAESRLDNLQDVATPTMARPIVIALVSIVFGGGWVFGAVMMAIEADSIAGPILLGLLGGFTLVFAVGRLVAAFGNWYVRAGPDGLAFRVPCYGWQTLVGGYAVREGTLTWGEIKSILPDPRRRNVLLLSEKITDLITASLIIELADVTPIIASMTCFNEPPHDIFDRINQYRRPERRLPSD